MKTLQALGQSFLCLPACISHKRPILINLFLAHHFLPRWIPSARRHKEPEPQWVQTQGIQWKSKQQIITFWKPLFWVLKKEEAAMLGMKLWLEWPSRQCLCSVPAVSRPFPHPASWLRLPAKCCHRSSSLRLCFENQDSNLKMTGGVLGPYQSHRLGHQHFSGVKTEEKVCLQISATPGPQKWLQQEIPAIFSNLGLEWKRIRET